jgi:lipopolysaccharide biosynthesis regulator YciM/ribosomal protein S16
MEKRTIILVCWLLLTLPSYGQQAATIKTYSKTIKSYLFSDPNPVASYTNIYPYFRFDGFTDQPAEKAWKAIDLENEYIKLTILPEIGGRIWSAVEKRTGKPFFYENHVLKFRDIALRGPWVSGGLEANYGIFGHSPGTSTPVDYLSRKNPDGSVSCFISLLDLLTRTTWMMEINLPADRAYFTTRSFWHNASRLEVPYYHWMNAAVKTAGNLEFIFPGTGYIGHSGEYDRWPMKDGRNLAVYDQNNFGGYKSYHVLGSHAEFFAAYWHRDQYGLVRYAPRDEKAGKKIWIWGQSGQGMIWEKLLTDTDGQYAEIQSGRLFNQTEVTSSYTPFKHLSFAPAASDSWTEYWYPVLQTGGVVEANAYGALNVQLEKQGLNIHFSPVRQIDDLLEVWKEGRLVYQKKLKLKPLQPFSVSLPFRDTKGLSVHLGENKLIYKADQGAKVLSRPLESPSGIDWNTAYGLYVQGKELMDHKLYDLAEARFRASMNKEPHFVPALVQLASLLYHKMEYKDALGLLRTSLSLNTYDGAANYYYGLVNMELDKMADAKDGFEIATLTPGYRAAAYNELARLYLRENNPTQALEYASKALQANAGNVTALEIRAVCYRKMKNKQQAGHSLMDILTLNPLSHFARFEQYLSSPDPVRQQAFQSLIHSELPVETYLELADTYRRMGSLKESLQVLELAPPNALVYLHRAYFKYLRAADYNPDLRLALEASPAFVFPFRNSDEPMLRWAIAAAKNDWKPRYFLALLYKDRNRIADYQQAFLSCANQPDFAPFYAARAQIHLQSTELNDLQKAVALDPDSWRYQKLLTEYFNNRGLYKKALEIIENFQAKHRENYLTGLVYANTLLLNKQYIKCLEVLMTQHILPFEGATTSRRIYRQALLNLALQAIDKQQPGQAMRYIERCRVWPEQLGVGKPYAENLDERMEDWLSYRILQTTGKHKQAARYLNKIGAFNPAVENGVRNFLQGNNLLGAWALRGTKGYTKAQDWLHEQLERYPNDDILKWSKEKFDQEKIDERQISASEIKILTQLLGFE